MTALSLSFDPIFPQWALILLGLLLGFAGVYALIRRARGRWVRLLFISVLLAALAGPQLIKKEQTALPDITLAMVDRSASNRLDGRKDETDRALEALAQNIREQGGELRVVTSNPDEDRTRLFEPLAEALSAVPKDQLSAAVIISDGRIDDAQEAHRLIAADRPIHSLITGDRSAIDRRIRIIRAPEFGLVDRPVTLELSVEEYPAAGTEPVALTIRQYGKPAQTRMVEPGKPVSITLMPERRGEMLVEVDAAPAAGETILVNNRALFSINAVRDRLRVLLISGEPHPGERVWRDTLNSDPAVDLIHFTILRLPSSQDPTPVSQLSLIPFPTEQLFAEQLHDFDLVIFDRYSLRGVLQPRYFTNLLDYVEQGGALFVANGPEYAESLSLYNTPLASVLPARPTGLVSENGYRPALTRIGRRHPVSKNLASFEAGASVAIGDEAQWGRWFRLIDSNVDQGQVLLEGPNAMPLLVLNHAGEGRIAQLMSDHIWLWARGIEGGGPYQELLRRSVHWLMKEPDLEETALEATADGDEIRIERRSLMPEQTEVTVEAPDGTRRTVTLTPDADGLARATISAPDPGLYRVFDTEDEAVVGTGPAGGHELSQILPTDQIVRDLAQKTGGGVFWLEDGLPDFRHPSEKATAFGANWIGLPKRNASRTDALSQRPLLPPLIWALLLGGLLAITWWRESR
ncbi:membrane protein [Iodidimonas nitroreducens]|uniref:Membrane protein n=1 Tax=Iodidimonas nitroreducens TaxID=1236968 RepID=A0A5A7N6J0_9PROT|nr:hypothetical protein [Iodidimonas nitroreducens]GAK33705.1 putative membrane protein [alpha proteobacterium Q-1]GER03943.1 membrane protein [Iodidimonas nitroreducens]